MHTCARSSRGKTSPVDQPVPIDFFFIYLSPCPASHPSLPPFSRVRYAEWIRDRVISLTLCNTPLGSASTSPLMPSRLRVSTLQSPNYISHAPTRSFFFYSLLLFTCHRDLFTYRRENFFSNNLPKKKTI